MIPTTTNRHRLLIGLAFISLMLIAIQPFLTGQMLRTDDGNLHLYRAIVLDHSLTIDGLTYPRYASGLVYGYGASLFNYFPPTSYFPTVILHRLGLDFVPAWLVTMSLYTLAAGWGAFLLGRQWTSAAGGLITATAYVYAPYFLFDTVIRGTSSEVAALAVLPYVLWALTCLARTGRRRDFVAVALCYALFVAQHNIIALHGSALIAVYALWLGLTNTHRWRTLGRLASAGGFGVLLSAFFWLPALTETDVVKINAVVENLSFIDVTRSLRPLSEVLVIPPTADPTRLQFPYPIGLSWITVIVALIGVGFALRLRDDRRRSLFALLAIVTATVAFLNTPASQIIWETVPLIGYSQFAWRTLGIPSLTLALMAGLTAALITREISTETRKIAVLSVFSAILMLYSIPWTYAPKIDLSASGIRDAHAYEQRTGELTLSSYSEYLPIWNQTPPDPTALTDRLNTGEPIARLQPDPAVTVTSSEWQGRRGVIIYRATEATRLIFDWLFVPGWQAHFLDEVGQSVALSVEPHGAEGFVSVEVPAGTHELEVSWQETPLQQTGWAISGLGVVLLGVVLILPRIWRPANSDPRPTESTRVLMALVVTGLLMFGFKVIVIDQVPNALRTQRLEAGVLSGVEREISANLGDEITLLGASQLEPVKSGETAKFDVFWALTSAPIETDYSSSIELVDSAGHVIAESGSFMPGGLATSNWLAGFYIAESVTLTVPPETPPADYAVRISLYDPTTLEALPILNADGNPTGVHVTAGTLTVIRPDTPVAVSSVPDDLGAVSLVAFDGLPDAATVGDPITIAPVWRLDEPVLDDQIATLIFTSGTDETASVEMPLVADFPVTEWSVGDVWRGYHTLFIPPDLPGGRVDVSVAIGDETVPIDTLEVSVPDRIFTMPPSLDAVDYQWDNGLRLVGFQRVDDAERGVTRVTVAWQTDRIITENLRLFVQVQAVDTGQILAVSDGVPVDWTRPVTGWSTEEVVITHHEFSLDQELETRLLIGWYQPNTGERVTVTDGGDAVMIE